MSPTPMNARFCNVGWYRLARSAQRRRAHIPRATGRVNISRSWVIRVGIGTVSFRGCVVTDLEEPANGRHRQPAQETR